MIVSRIHARTELAALTTTTVTSADVLYRTLATSVNEVRCIKQQSTTHRLVYVKLVLFRL